MKKLLSVFMILAMLFAPCAWAEDADVTGEWYMVQAIMGEMTFNPAEVGMDMTAIFNADGTASMISAFGEETDTAEGTWTRTEAGVEVTISESTTLFVMDGDQLKTDMGGEGAFIFGREKPEATPLPGVIAAQSEDAFLGKWSSSLVSMMGMTVSAEAANMAMTLIVEPGKATMNTGDGEPEEMVSAFADGVLVLTEKTMGEIKMQLTDDGGVCMEVRLGEDSVMTIYLVKAE